MRKGATLVVLACVVVGAVGLAALRMASIVSEVRQARADREAADKQIADLKAQLAELNEPPAILPGKPTETALPKEGLRSRRPPASAEAATNLLHRFDELAALQVKTLALVQTLADKMGEAGSPAQKLKQREASLAALEAALKDQQQRAATAKRTMEELRVSLEVPADVVTLEPATGLAVESLRQYWPYLEAKKDLQAAEQVVESLERRLRQEKAGAVVDAYQSAPAK